MTSPTMTQARESFEAWIDFERRTGIHEAELDGFLLWNAIRFPLHAQQLMAVRGAQITGDATVRQKEPPRRQLIRAARSLLSYADRLQRGEEATVVVPHSRRIHLKDGRRICTYVDPLFPIEERRNLLWLEGPRDSEPMHAAPWWDNRGKRYELAPRWRPLRETFSSTRGLVNWWNNFGAEAADFLAPLGGRRTLLRRVGVILRKRLMWRSTLAHWLEQVQPARCILVVHYTDFCQILMHEARAAGVPIWELQHGSIDDQAMPYVHLTLPRVYPDKFLLFGDAWRAAVPRLPLRADQTPAIGFPWLNHSLESSANEDPESTELQAVGTQAALPNTDGTGEKEEAHTRVLFINQWTLAQELVKWALALADARPDVAVRFRLHPAERQSWKESFPELAAHQGIEVIAEPTSVYDDFRWATHQVGVNSTALCEGIALGCRTALAGLPGAERYDFLVERKLAGKVAQPVDLIRAIRDDTLPAVDQGVARDLWQTDSKARLAALMAET